MSPRLSVGDGDGKPATYESFAPLIAQFHRSTGVAISSGVQSWRDSIGNLTPQRPGIPQSPAYALDGAHFGGKQVVQFDAAAGKMLSRSPISPPLMVVGVKPWAMLVARPRTWGTGNRWLFRVTDSPATQGILGLLSSGGTTLIVECCGVNTTYPVTDTLPHIFEVYLSADNKATLAIDGVIVSQSPAAASTVPAAQIAIGGNIGNVNASDLNVGLLLIGDQLRADAAAASQRTLARAEFGM